MIQIYHGFYYTLAFAKLGVVEVGVEAVLGHEFVVVAAFDDVAITDDQDYVGIFDGGETVGNDEGGSAFGKFVDGLLD